MHLIKSYLPTLLEFLGDQEKRGDLLDDQKGCQISWVPEMLMFLHFCIPLVRMTKCDRMITFLRVPRGCQTNNPLKHRGCVLPECQRVYIDRGVWRKNAQEM